MGAFMIEPSWNNPHNVPLIGYVLSDFFADGGDVLDEVFSTASEAMEEAKRMYLGRDCEGVGVNLDVQRVY